MMDRDDLNTHVKNHLESLGLPDDVVESVSGQVQEELHRADTIADCNHPNWSVTIPPSFRRDAEETFSGTLEDGVIETFRASCKLCGLERSANLQLTPTNTGPPVSDLDLLTLRGVDGDEYSIDMDRISNLIWSTDWREGDGHTEAVLDIAERESEELLE